MENTPLPEDNRPEWLRGMEQESWNMELVISGAAIFLASFLPSEVALLRNAYLENLTLDEDFRKVLFPLLAFSFLKVTAWLLLLTFVLHFGLRAFWVGLVGLHTVYTGGIRYERLPWITDVTREQMRQRFGTLSDYMLRLDKICNLVFSIAFLFALFSLAIGFAYFIVFFALEMLPVLIEDRRTAKYLGYAILSIMALGAFLPMLLQVLLRNPRFAESQRLHWFSDWAMRRSSNFVTPFVARPINYLNLTFSSNISKWRMTAATLVSMVLIFACVIGNFTGEVKALAGQTAFSTRDFFALGQNNPFSLKGNAYDNLRGAEEPVPPLSIPSEIVETGFLRVFVHYPKSLDAALQPFCPKPILPDSLNSINSGRSRIRNWLTDSVHLRCFGQFFRLQVNDSLLADPQWLFHEHPTAKVPGLVAYLPSGLFKLGQNRLTLRAPSAARPDSLREYGQLPFWYAPK
jgi:hypothetical protein